MNASFEECLKPWEAQVTTHPLQGLHHIEWFEQNSFHILVRQNLVKQTLIDFLNGGPHAT